MRAVRDQNVLAPNNDDTSTVAARDVNDGSSDTGKKIVAEHLGLFVAPLHSNLGLVHERMFRFVGMEQLSFPEETLLLWDRT